jgi:hypothetical protein
LKGGRTLLCANLANLALAGAIGGCGPVATSVGGMSAGHGPLPSARDGGVAHVAAPGLSAEHGPLRATHGHSPATAIALGLPTGHGPLRTAPGHGPVVAAGLRWTCGPDSPSYHAPSGEGIPYCSFLTSVSDSTHELVALERSKSIGV